MLDYPGESGISLREHLEKVEQTTGKRPAKLDEEPEIPDSAEYLWLLFWELNGRRTGSGFGGNPITYADLLAWMNIHGISLTPWEVQTLMELDAEFMSFVNGETKKKLDQQKNQYGNQNVVQNPAGKK